MSTPDKNWLSFADKQSLGEMAIDVVIPPDGSYADALKFSNAQNGIIRGRLIVGGYEDCVDCNRNCANLDVHFDSWEPRGKYVITDKGHSVGNRFSGTIERHASEVDVDLGNGSDQSTERTQGTRLNLAMRDGSPVRVRVLNAWRPIFENSPRGYVVNDTWKGVFVYVWLVLHRLHLL